jgi:hypothetical protein
MKKVKLIKLFEAENPRHPNNIPEGFVKEGYPINEPTVGESFLMNTDDGDGWHTSIVQEIFEDGTFKTFNSIYKIVRE